MGADYMKPAEENARKLERMRDEVLALKESPLYAYRTENAYFPVMGEGSAVADVMFVGEAPGETEAKTGKPFCGRSGKLFDELLASIGVDRASVYVTNLVKDRPPGNRDPEPAEIALYAPFLERQIDIIRPKVIATLGRHSMKFVFERYGLSSELKTVSKIHGMTFRGQASYGPVTVVALYHPAFALYNGSMKPVLMGDFKALEKYKQTKHMHPMKTTWNLGLLYKGHDDPQIEKDVRTGERAFAAFEKRYKGKTDYLKGEAKLLVALTEFEAMFRDLTVAGPIMYFHYVTDLDSADAVARARSTQLSERYAKNDQRIAFFELSLGKVSAPLQKKFLASKKLSRFRYYLKVVFDRAAHNLSESEERIMRLKGIPAHEQWVNGTEKLLGKASVEFRGKNLPVPEAANVIGDLPLPDRYELHESLMRTLGGLADVAESELNAIVTDKKINDELRGYGRAYDATILGYQNNRKSVLALVDVVTENFHISHRFHALKAKLLGLDRLRYPDRIAGIESEVKKVSFDEAVSILRQVFGSIDPRYLSILDGYLERSQVDVYPRKGKTGGAYCSGSLNMPTFVLLNFTETLDQVSTFAHEMGHAIHTELSKPLSPLYQGYSMSTAEVASTLFESFVFDALFEKMSEEEKIAALHNKINDDVSTIFRQIACFNFENDMHNLIREKGGASVDELRELMNRHMSAYLGPVFDLRPEDANYLVSWGHLRRFFYVYSYAFGQLVSKALYANYKKDKKYIDKINAFMSAGGSDSPENIFKSVGIDVTRPDFWRTGLASIEADIERLEKLADKVKNK